VFKIIALTAVVELSVDDDAVADNAMVCYPVPNDVIAE
jgi:hypothetical protein